MIASRSHVQRHHGRAVAWLLLTLGGAGLTGTWALAAAMAHHAALRPPARGAVAVAREDRPDFTSAPLWVDRPSATPLRASGSPRAPKSAPASSWHRGYPRVVVPSVGIDLPVIEGNGDAPPDYVAAHFPGTASPGSGGNVYLYAHDLRGMFLALHNVAAGALVELQLAPGQSLDYVVSEIHPLVASTDFEYTQPTADDRVTLQTCNWPDNQDKRFIVVASRTGG